MATGITAHETIAPRTQDIAHELFEVVTQICLSTLRGRRRAGELKEIEFLTLAILQANGTMIVGDIQRLLGILPAQMSRVIRALENCERPLIQCRINPRDKRKIDVCLTSHGDKTLLDYQGTRIGRIVERLQSLSDEDQEDLVRSLNKLHGLLERTPA
ncbi:MAG: MarR family transcriptional regulator [Planctomycetes bacterium]|nr:MarR family transcriptional regulator [Planctomycetota bacterium]